MIYASIDATELNEASALFRNVFAEGVLAWSSQSADGFAANALGPQTYDFWTPTALPATLSVTLGAAVECDACAIIGSMAYQGYGCGGYAVDQCRHDRPALHHPRRGCR